MERIKKSITSNRPTMPALFADAQKPDAQGLAQSAVCFRLHKKQTNMEIETLIEVGKILATKKDFMRQFMERYILQQLGLKLDDDILSKENYTKIIDFCLNTRQRIVNNELVEGKNYFKEQYSAFVNYYQTNDIEELKELVYRCPGVGQKIGSFILEVFIHYFGKNKTVEKELFLPIDTHTRRILVECLEVKVPGIGENIKTKNYNSFQKFLLENTPENENRIIFDYLWFVGKVFCVKVSENINSNTYSRGYKLCNLCWINELCKYKNKWIIKNS